VAKTSGSSSRPVRVGLKPKILWASSREDEDATVGRAGSRGATGEDGGATVAVLEDPKVDDR